ncbi:flagellar hook-length control protein FliK [Sulfitobacter sp. S190]|uniref:flagellar hook-length control protein FliK n=1 Tax=Sulfitobacter sp. S190 TaxID=2867022 RepID=UPI0021A30E88|nr:flagellar hook-length control protein FliK [Sulfitobacter sp. S190]UWR22381.1 flagellar hook-length control protein FliK [Sulfitobacter sp. S190]
MLREIRLISGLVFMDVTTLFDGKVPAVAVVPAGTSDAAIPEGFSFAQIFADAGLEEVAIDVDPDPAVEAEETGDAQTAALETDISDVELGEITGLLAPAQEAPLKKITSNNQTALMTPLSQNAPPIGAPLPSPIEDRVTSMTFMPDVEMPDSGTKPIAAPFRAGAGTAAGAAGESELLPARGAASQNDSSVAQKHGPDDGPQIETAGGRAAGATAVAQSDMASMTIGTARETAEPMRYAPVTTPEIRQQPIQPVQQSPREKGRTGYSEIVTSEKVFALPEDRAENDALVRPPEPPSKLRFSGAEHVTAPPVTPPQTIAAPKEFAVTIKTASPRAGDMASVTLVPETTMTAAPWETHRSTTTPLFQSTRVDMPVHVARQLAEAAPSAQTRPIDVSLSPMELGRVKMSITPEETGLTVHIIAERGETIDLMRRHIDVLGQQFKSLGYEDISFAFGESGADPETGDEASNGNAQSARGPSDDLVEVEEQTTRPDTGSGIDIRL